MLNSHGEENGEAENSSIYQFRRHRFWMMENKHRELKREQIVFMQQDRNCRTFFCLALFCLHVSNKYSLDYAKLDKNVVASE